MKRFVRIFSLIVLPVFLLAQDLSVDLLKLEEEITQRGEQMDYVYKLTEDRKSVV